MPPVQWSYPLSLILTDPGKPLAGAGERIATPDLIRMHQGGLRDATILDFIQTYQVSLSISDAEWVELGQAGLESTTIKALRDHAFAHPGTPSKEAPRIETKSVKKAPLPRFLVAYPHDPNAFPSWYYGPFSADANSATHHPRREDPRSGQWRDNARSVWFHGRRL